MQKKRSSGQMKEPGPVVLHPEGIYTLEGLRGLLGLGRHSLTFDIRKGRLRVTYRGGRYYVLGAWVLQWLQAGERKRRPRRPDDGLSEPSRSGLVERIVRSLEKLTDAEREQVRRMAA